MNEYREDSGETHWTKRLFVENSELYMPFLEQAKSRAQMEADALIALFAELGVPEGGRVLDVACGIGRHAVLLAKAGYRVEGVDISPAFVREARRYARAEGVDACFTVGDFLRLDERADAELPFDAFINMFTSCSPLTATMARTVT